VAILRVVVESVDCVNTHCDRRLREVSTHLEQRVTAEVFGIDVGVVSHDVAAQLLEDRLAPPDVEGVRRGEGQQQVAK